MKTVTFTTILLLAASLTFAQGVSINNNNAAPDPSAMLDVQSTEKGMLVPRMKQVQRQAIANPAEGLLIYQTNSTPGFYYNAGTPQNPDWQLIGSAAAQEAVWFEDGDNIYRTEGNVGVGTDNPAYPLHIKNNTATRTIYGVSTANSGITYGGWFESVSTGGRGVYGNATAASGLSIGGLFVSNSSAGRAVQGNAQAMSGETRAVSGHVDSPEGYAAYFTGSVGSSNYFQRNVGIGIANPNYPLHVQTEAATRAIYGVSTANSGIAYGGWFESGSTSGIGLIAIADAASGTTYGVRGHVSSTSGYSGYFTGGSFFVGGNVGLGTSSPDYRLHVSGGNIYASSSSWPIRGVKTGSGTFPGVWGETESTSSNATGVRGYVLSISPGTGSSGVHGRNFGTGALGYGVRGNHDGSGAGVYGQSATGIGVHGHASASAGSAFGVLGTANTQSDDNAGVRGEYGQESWGELGYNLGGVRGGHANFTSGFLGTAFFGVRGRVLDFFQYAVYGQAISSSWAGYFNGDVEVTGTFSNPSDARLKKNRHEPEGVLGKLSKLRPAAYEYKNDEFGFMNLPTGLQYGLIAGELEAVFPELVRTTIHPASEPSESGPQNDAFEYSSVNYLGLIPLLLKGMQELNAIIEAQNARIMALENQIITSE